MPREKLCYVSTDVSDWLAGTIENNLPRYLEGGFADEASAEGWSIPLALDFDPGPLADLRPETGMEAEVFNSLLVWQCLSNLTPSLAVEGRIWTRLSHLDGLPYARGRWIGDATGADAVKLINLHCLATTRTRCRDDNAIGRLWWNAYIANQAMPGQHHDALKALLKTADIRSNIVERSRFGSLPRLAGGILRAVSGVPAVTASEGVFREFMKTVNLRGGGVLFEIMEPAEIDAWLADCVAADAVRDAINAVPSSGSEGETNEP